MATTPDCREGRAHGDRVHPRARDVERDRVDARADVGIGRVDRPAERAGAAVVERVGHREGLRQEHTALHRLQAGAKEVPTMPLGLAAAGMGMRFAIRFTGRLLAADPRRSP